MKKKSKGKLTKKEIKDRWLTIIKKEYPWWTKEEKLLALFDIFPFLKEE